MSPMGTSLYSYENPRSAKKDFCISLKTSLNLTIGNNLSQNCGKLSYFFYLTSREKVAVQMQFLLYHIKCFLLISMFFMLKSIYTNIPLRGSKLLKTSEVAMGWLQVRCGIVDNKHRLNQT